jgi:hypothetical protein
MLLIDELESRTGQKVALVNGRDRKEGVLTRLNGDYVIVYGNYNSDGFPVVGYTTVIDHGQVNGDNGVSEIPVPITSFNGSGLYSVGKDKDQAINLLKKYDLL